MQGSLSLTGFWVKVWWVKGADGDGCVKWTRRRNVGKSFSYENYKTKLIFPSTSGTVQLYRTKQRRSLGQLRWDSSGRLCTLLWDIWAPVSFILSNHLF